MESQPIEITQPFLGQALKEPKQIRASDAPSRARQLVSEGDTLFSTVRTYLKNIAYVDERFDGQIASTGFCVLRPTDRIEGRYIYYYTLTKHFVERVSGLQRGVSYPAVRDVDVKAQPIPLAPAAEQRRIVERIDELFSLIEAGEQALGRARTLLEGYRQSVLNAAVTGELTKEWREKHKGTIESGEDLLKRILQARREAWEKAALAKLQARGKPPTDTHWKQKYKEPQPPDLADPPKIPDGWQLVSCDALSYHITSGSRAWKSFYDQGDSTFVMAQNVRPGRYDPTFQQRVKPPSADPETERTRIRGGDLLVTIVGANTGDVCEFDRDVEDHYVCQSVALIRPCSETYGRYLTLYFQAEDGGQRQYKRYIYGAGRPHLSFDQLRQTVVALPPETEAEEILERTDELMSDIGNVASALVQQPRYSAALRQAILAAAFSGRLVPQDPADEPAAALLARIRAERAATGNRMAPAAKPRGRPRRVREPELPLLPTAKVGRSAPE